MQRGGCVELSLVLVRASYVQDFFCNAPGGDRRDWHRRCAGLLGMSAQNWSRWLTSQTKLERLGPRRKEAIASHRKAFTNLSSWKYASLGHLCV